MSDEGTPTGRSQALRQIPRAASDVTVVLTSCNRQDLLERTLDSFFLHNTYPIREFIVIEDGDGSKNDHLRSRYENTLLAGLIQRSAWGRLLPSIQLMRA